MKFKNPTKEQLITLYNTKWPMENVTHNLKMLQTTTTLRPRVFLSSWEKFFNCDSETEAIQLK